MKTVLDLIGEFAFLNDAKVRCGGTLPRDSEHRWCELKSFYDLIMSQNGLSRRPVTRRFTSSDIRKTVRSRERLRVRVEMDMILRIDGEYQTVQVVNISRGGVYLASDKLFPVGACMTLFIANAYGDGEALFEAEGKIVWSCEQGIPLSGLPRGMGVRFVGPQEEVRRQLDSFIVETLEMRLSGVDANALALDFITRENLEL